MADKPPIRVIFIGPAPEHLRVLRTGRPGEMLIIDDSNGFPEIAAMVSSVASAARRPGKTEILSALLDTHIQTISAPQRPTADDAAIEQREAARERTFGSKRSTKRSNRSKRR